MASQGPRYPVTITTEAGGGASAWNANTANFGADDNVISTLTVASFDTNVISHRVKCQNFGFTIPAGATIDGIVVEIERRFTTVGGAVDNQVQLYNAAGTLVGTNKADTLTPWPAVLAVATYGTSSDTWAASLTDVDVNDADFGVAFQAKATLDNTDIAADYLRVTVHYTEGAAARVPYRNRYAQLIAH